MHTLVVGVDGGVDARAALDWAAGSVGHGGVVHAVWAVEGPPEEALPEFPQEWIDRTGTAGASIETHVVRGEPARALLAVAEERVAEAVVIGPHHQPHLSPRRAGKVAASLLVETDRPVIVVRDGTSSRIATNGNVVVGVGGGAATRASVEFAARHASAHGMGLTLVRVVGAPSLWRPEDLLDVIAYHLDPPKLVEWAEEDLADLATELQSTVDGRLDVEWHTASGLLGPNLVEAAAEASLLVIGLRRGSFADHFTAPALHHTLTHAPCPVAVVVAAD